MPTVKRSRTQTSSPVANKKQRKNRPSFDVGTTTGGRSHSSSRRETIKQANSSSSSSSSSSSHVATRAQTTKQGLQALATKFLGICLVTYGVSVSFAVLSFKAVILFGLSDDGGSEGGGTSSSSSDQPSQVVPVQFPPSDCCFRMGFGTSGTKIYLLGGQNQVNKPSSDTAPLEVSNSSKTKGKKKTSLESSDSDITGQDAVVFPRYSQHDYSSKVFTLDLANSKPPYKASEAPEMISGMASPLAITVKEKQYVLAGLPLSMLPDYPFVVYDPKNNSWEKLPSPPFLKPNSMLFQDPQIRSWVVIDNKINVSTSSSSFSFDTTTTTKEWKSCTFFDDPHLEPHRPQWIDMKIPSHFRWMKCSPNSDKDKQGCGLPFDFEGGAVMYDDDVMIGLVPSRGYVVAYKLDDKKEKVMRTQRLEGLEIPPDATSAYLADFREGYLCLLTVSNDLRKQDCQISITPFQVSKLKSESPQKRQMNFFLECTPHKTLIHLFKGLPPSTEQLPQGKIWSSLGCFVM